MMEKEWSFEFIDVEHNTTHRLVHDVDGWKEFGVSFGRSTEIANIVKSYTVDFKFFKEDAAWLKRILFNYGTNNRVRFLVRQWGEVVYSGYVDFTQMSISSDCVSVPIEEGGFFQRLENQWDSEFDIRLDSIVNFTGNVFRFDVEYFEPKSNLRGTTLARPYPITNSSAWRDNGNFTFMTLPIETDDSSTEKVSRMMSTNISEEVFATVMCTVSGPEYGDLYVLDFKKDNCLISAENEYIKNIHYQFEGTFRFIGTQTLLSSAYFNYCEVQFGYFLIKTSRLDVKSIGGCTATNMSAYHPIYESGAIYPDNGIIPIDIPPTTGDINLNAAGYSVIFCFKIWTGNTSTPYTDVKLTIQDYSGVTLSVTTDTNLNRNLKISAIRSSAVFSQLLGLINSNSGQYALDIDDSILDTDAAGDILTGNEGLRGYNALVLRTQQGRTVKAAPRGQIRTSLSKYLQYLYRVHNICFGCTYDREADVYRIRLARYADFYREGETIAEVGSFNDIEASVERSLLYSEVKIGFQEGDAYNGKLDVNKLLTFATPNSEIEQNALDLVSPYNGAARQIETYLYDNYFSFEDSTDKDSTVYLIDAVHIRTDNYSTDDIDYIVPVYELKRTQSAPIISVVNGSLYPGYEWNLRYSAQQMLSAHMQELCSYFAFEQGEMLQLRTRGLTFHTLNKDGEQWSENANRTLSEQPLFYPLKLTFSAPARQGLIAAVEAHRCGVFHIRSGGIDCKGFIAKGTDSITINPMNEEPSTFTLLLTDKSIIEQI